MTDSLSGLVKQVVEHFSETRRLFSLFTFFPCLVAMVLSLAACGPREQKPQASPRPVKYITVKPATQEQPEQMTGDIHAHNETSLGFRLDGRIQTRTVDVGDSVEAGEILATMDNSTLVNSLHSAQADTDSARANERVAALNMHRMKQLMPSGAIARTQLDTAQSDWESAAARLKSADASLKSARENLTWTQLKSPFSGIVTAVSASAGQVVSAGQTVVSLAYGAGRDVVLDVPQPALFSSLSNNVFHVYLLSSPQVTATAHLRDISPQADPQTRTWRVRLTLDNPPKEMFMGASVSVSLPSVTPRTFALPETALTRLDGKPAVFELDLKRSMIQRKPVVISRFSTTEVYIERGLDPGDRIVTAGVSTLRDGERVTTGEEQQ